MDELEAQLATPPFPLAIEYLYLAWMRLRKRKGAGMTGPAPIEWPDIDAFCRLTGQRLAPWEVRIIEALDDVHQRVMALDERDPEAMKASLLQAGKARR
ncbi:phage tail assembly chaperone [Pelagibius sp.]|uniref:phage tail assembly chaperone n=1 Tax=Pelagibius sp. TaxID=1931238 RepID=UPI003BB144F0